MAEVFAFRDSTADSAGSDIFTTMNEIKQTLATNRTAINNLKPEWVSVEADGLADVLDNVKQTLLGVKDGTGDVKKSIGEILDATK